MLSILSDDDQIRRLHAALEATIDRRDLTLDEQILRIAFLEGKLRQVRQNARGVFSRSRGSRWVSTRRSPND